MAKIVRGKMTRRWPVILIALASIAGVTRGADASGDTAEYLTCKGTKVVSTLDAAPRTSSTDFHFIKKDLDGFLLFYLKAPDVYERISTAPNANAIMESDAIRDRSNAAHWDIYVHTLLKWSGKSAPVTEHLQFDRAANRLSYEKTTVLADMVLNTRIDAACERVYAPGPRF